MGVPPRRTSLVPAVPGALDMIEQLQDAGMVVAAAEQRASLLHTPRTGRDRLASILDDVIISSEEKIRKPARDLYMLALDREFVTAKHALMSATTSATTSSAPIPPASTRHTSARKFHRRTTRTFRHMRYVRLPEPTTTGC